MRFAVACLPFPFKRFSDSVILESRDRDNRYFCAAIVVYYKDWGPKLPKSHSLSINQMDAQYCLGPVMEIFQFFSNTPYT